MSNATVQSNSSNGRFEISEEEIRSRVAEIQSRWSSSERARREALGHARRHALLTSLGLMSHRECA